MQPSLRVLIPFAFFAYAQASLVQPRSAPSAIPVPILDNSAAIAQAKPGRTAATKAIPGGAVTNAGLQPHNLTGNAAQTDALLYLCQEQNCGGTCEYFDLNTLSPNTCYYPQPVFPYLSAHIEDGGVALPYAVYCSVFSGCITPGQIPSVGACYNFKTGGLTENLYYFYFT